MHLGKRSIPVYTITGGYLGAADAVNMGDIERP